ncbi:MAG: succinate-semialdehyde dehydrogenase / glutarate-semialdehyde dehydrogenase [Candidatus Sumerlaeota bacterium]|nr:succinate-semialdehyde dehydrogenase / glutarate-semialdehyde dehydrogenase [Candidatus Sumerlaeota bacterium]
MNVPYKQFINGEWVDASNGKTWDVINPATEQAVRTVPFGNDDDCRAAITAAEKAFPAWSRLTAYNRADILMRASRLIAERLETLHKTNIAESGKPIADAKGDWLAAAALFEWFAEEGKRAYGRTVPSRRAGRRQLVLRQPVGVVGIITAWNFPAYNVARATAAALAAGCTVVIRPSEYTPMTAMEMVALLHEAGIPKGVVNLVNGDPHAMGQEMLNNPACRKIAFTGSVRVGKLLMDGASRTVTRLSLELGGNAPVLLFNDSDIDALAAGAVSAKYRNNGQVCVSPQRFFVHRKVRDQFVERVVPLARALRVGNGAQADTQVGPLINARQRDRVEELVNAAPGEGAEIATGGARPDFLTQGYFFQPTVISGVKPEARLFNEEVFGPVMPVIDFDDVDEAIELANRTSYGLAAYVFTENLKVAARCWERLEFGMVGVNEWGVSSIEAPFAGWKQSGIGRECGQEGLDDYLETKLVALAGIE